MSETATLSPNKLVKGRSMLDLRRQKVRRELIVVGTEIFAERGIEQVSVEDILERALISRRTFYSYFSSKDDLLVQILEPILKSGTRRLKQISAKRPSAIIEQIAEVYLALWQENSRAFYIITHVGQAQFQLLKKPHTAFTNQLVRLIAPFDGSPSLRGRSAEHTYNLISRCAVPILKVYGDDHNMAGLYVETLKDLLLARAAK